MRDRLHRLDVDGRNTALRVLHDDVEHAFAVAHALLRHAAQIDRAEHGAVFGVDHRRVLGRVTKDVDPFVEGIEVDAVRLCGAHINRKSHADSSAAAATSAVTAIIACGQSCVPPASFFRPLKRARPPSC